MDVSKKREEEQKIVTLMVEVYCRRKHRKEWEKGDKLCSDCQKLRDYACLRTQKCPFMETKTFCSACKVHCYAPDQKDKIKEVMRTAGPWMLLYHPILAVRHAIITLKNIRKMKKNNN